MSGARPVLAGVHHLKLPVSDLAASLLWWETAFGARRQEHLDHFTPEGVCFGYILSVPGVAAPLELVLDAGHAGHRPAFDPVALAVETRDDLVGWTAWFDAVGVANSGLLRGLGGWLVVVRDPDETPVRLYSHETHEWDAANADFGSAWL